MSKETFFSREQVSRYIYKAFRVSVRVKVKVKIRVKVRARVRVRVGG